MRKPVADHRIAFQHQNHAQQRRTQCHRKPDNQRSLDEFVPEVCAHFADAGANFPNIRNQDCRNDRENQTTDNHAPATIV